MKDRDLTVVCMAADARLIPFPLLVAAGLLVAIPAGCQLADKGGHLTRPADTDALPAGGVGVSPVDHSQHWRQNGPLRPVSDTRSQPPPKQSPELQPQSPASVSESRWQPAGQCSEWSEPSREWPQGTEHRPRYRFRDDLRKFLPLLKDDARGVANWNNAAILGGALVGAIGIRQDLDEEVREATARHPERWGRGTDVLGYLGEVQYQTPVLLGLYAYSLHRQDTELRRLSSSLISAYTLSGLGTVGIKVIANTDRPSDDWNGGQFGFPSFHASSSFSIASVLDEYYGSRVGLPAYALAGLIGWSRIDERDHDLSDVVFGAALGYVIGKSVAGRHLRDDSRVRLLPYVRPNEGSGGLMFDLSF